MNERTLDRDALAARPVDRRETIRAGARLLAELPGGRASLLLLVTLTLAEVAAQVVVALAARRLLLAVTRAETGFPLLPAVAGGVAAVLTFVLVRARHRHQERLAVSCRERAAARLARHLHRADMEDLSATPMAGLREVLMTDIDFAYRFLLDSISQLTVLSAWLAAAVVLTAWLSPPLLVVLIVLGSVVAVATIRSTRAHLALTPQRFSRLAAVSQQARDVVEVERVIVARQFGLGDLFVRRFLSAHDAFGAVAQAQGRLTATMRAVVSSLGAITFLAVVVTGGALVLRGDLGVGSLVAVLFVLAQLLGAVAALGDYAGRLAETATAGRRLMAFWDDPRPDPDRPDPGRPDTAVEPPESLRATGVAFGYAGGPTLLAGVDLELRRSRPAALTAATGAGKSTLALVLTGVLHPQHGTVELTGGEGVLAPDQVPPGRVLYVGSKPVLVPGSIRDNLLLDSDPDAGAGQEAALAEFVTRVTAGALPFPLGATVVGPNGTGLSSGQAQLVQLARAVHRNPDVIVFDEATSSLDIETEIAVQRALLDWCAQRITLVVSHRRCPWTEAALDRLTLVPQPGSTTLRVVSTPADRPGEPAGPSHRPSRRPSRRARGDRPAMKILHLVNYGWPYVDGYTARSRSLVSAQRGELGLDAVVAVSPYTPFARARDPELVADGWGPQQRQLPGGPARRGERPALGVAPVSARSFRRGLQDLVDELAPDVVHAHHPAFVGRVGLAVAHSRGLPFVYELRCFNGDYDLDSRHPYLRARGHRQNHLELALARAADQVVTISDGLAGRLVDGGVDRDRVSVVRNAVDTALWPPLPPADHPGVLRIGYATTFEAIEGLDLLVEAAGATRDRLAEAGLRLEVVLAGTGRDWDRIRDLVAEAGLTETVLLPGFLTRERLQRFYADLDLFVVPRRPAVVATDTTPLKPLEALASARPLLTTDLPALRELLAGQPGVRHVPASAAGLTEGILAFAAEPWHSPDPVDLGERSWAAEVQRYRAVYDRLLVPADA